MIMKTRVELLEIIEQKLLATNHYQAKECIALVQEHESLDDIMLPASMIHLKKIVEDIVKVQVSK